MRTSIPNGLIPKVWQTTDPYLHVDLDADWDAIDVVLGQLRRERPALGDLKIAYQIPGAPSPGNTSWVPCDGRTLSGGSHDFSIGGGTITIEGQTIGVDGGGNLHLPDLRGHSFMGADATLAIGAAATASDASFPGPGGAQGSNNLVTIPAHFHQHQHIHAVGGINGVETGTSTDNGNVQGGVGANSFAKGDHAHQLLALYSSNPRDPTNASTRVQDASPNTSAAIRYQTTLQILADLGTNATTPTGGSAGANLQIDARPHSVGVVILMYVHAQT